MVPRRCACSLATALSVGRGEWLLVGRSRSAAGRHRTRVRQRGPEPRLADWGRGLRAADRLRTGASAVRDCLCVGWWVWPDFRGDGVRFSGTSATGLGGTTVADVNRALELAQQHDLYLMLTLFSFDGFRDDYSPNLQAIVTNSTARSALVNNAVRPFSAAAAASPNRDRVISWDVINQVQCQGIR